MVTEIDKLPSTWRLNAAVFRASMFGSKQRGEWRDLTYVRPSVVVNENTVRQYASSCGFSVEQCVPMLFPHIEAFPLALMIFASDSFPFRAMGVIHLANTTTLHRPIQIGDQLRIEVRTGDLKSHDKGQVFSMHACALRAGVLVWSSTWTFLRLDVANPSGSPYRGVARDELPLERHAELVANLKTTRRYASVSGDVNPLHINHIAAKMMGCRRAIAHGMWTKARALALLSPMHELDYCEVCVEFKSPIFLPSKSVLWARQSALGSRFEVRNNMDDKVHMHGELKLFKGENPA